MASPPPLAHWMPVDLLQFELDAVFAIQQWRTRQSWRHHVQKLLSPHPLYDVSVVTPILLVFSLPFAGYCLFWTAFLSFLTSFILDKLIRAHTPRRIDPRIVALSQCSPGGFPCFELCISAAVYTSLAQTYRKPGIDAALLVLFLVLAALKLFSTSYFVYSMVLSTALGVGVALAVHGFAHSRFPLPHSLSGSHKLAGAFIGMFVFLMILAYRIEVNAAPVLRVPRREFERVIELIHHGPDPSQ